MSRTFFMGALLAVLPVATTSCVSSSAQVQPAVAGAIQLQTLFQHEQGTMRALVLASNPQPATLEAFTTAQADTAKAFDTTLAAHLEHLRSLGGLSIEAFQQITAAALETYRQIKPAGGAK